MHRHRQGTARLVAGGALRPRRGRWPSAAHPRTITAPGLLRRQLERILEAGVAFEHEESAVGIACVAAPILDPLDQPVGAISITGPVPRFRPEAATTAVRAAAAGVGSILARRSTEPNAALGAAGRLPPS
ncbi:IclR family transcriptional regulator domain-containing protein [Blastococcus sp. PRF04-17]|uniref:IclR family transcriptional regulator domain-containing protein n=1 Tax=Blastococcus sp. PRF04-17 TaxID=2933797 RepID=UPI0035302B56